MPAAALAAKSGVPVLLTTQDALSARTRAALAALNDPRIYVIGPTSAVGAQVVKALRPLGTVVRIAGRTPSGTSIALARYADSQFGWGVGQPGHGLVFASAAGNPQLAAAAAGLSTSGSYGPLVLLGDPGLLDLTTESYLTDLQPHTHGDPAHGVYNHAWIVGDEAAVSVALQAQIDRLLEITTVP
jgi:putative cell wall binding repeat protein